MGSVPPAFSQNVSIHLNYITMVEQYNGILTMHNFYGLCLLVVMLGALFFITQNEYHDDENYYKKTKK